jgi:hypothetical protein
VPSKRGSRPDVGRRGYGHEVGTGNHPAVRYGDIDAELLRESIDAVTSAGDAFVFGCTSDKGAFVVRVLSDAGNGVWYPPTAAALAGVLAEAANIARGL